MLYVVMFAMKSYHKQIWTFFLTKREKMQVDAGVYWGPRSPPMWPNAAQPSRRHHTGRLSTSPHIKQRDLSQAVAAMWASCSEQPAGAE